MTESPIMNEPICHMTGSGPSRDGLRRAAMGHVAMKVLVTSDLEQRHVAVVHHMRKSTDGPL